jgi:serine/threonine protein kinase
VQPGSADITLAGEDGGAPTDTAGREAETSAVLERAGRFELRRVLGKGSMGRVYEAFDPELDRIAAVKVLRTPATDEATRSRLQQEAHALARLSHANVIEVYDIGVAQGHLFIAMQYHPGTTLGVWLREQRPSLQRVVEVFVEAGRGLAAAHAAGVVHCDFKPDNVLVSDKDGVKVVDFGISREGALPSLEASTSAASSARLTASGRRSRRPRGTPRYMAPECFAGKLPTTASDQFSFCVALFEAVTGRRLFDGDNAAEILISMGRGSTELERPAGVPGWLARVLRRGLSMDPDERYESMDALLAELTADHSGLRRWWLAVGGVAMAGLAVASMVGSSDARCETDQDVWSGVWDDAIRAELDQAVAKQAAPSPAWSDLSSQLDDYVARWTAEREKVCRAISSGDSELVVDRRIACLDRRRASVAALVGALRRSDGDVSRLPGALESLPAIEGCGAHDLDDAVEMPPPAIVNEVDLQRRRLAEAQALDTMGEIDEALALAEETLDRADDLDFQPLIAEALLSVGAHLRRHDPQRARSTLERAYFTAQRIGYDRVAATAALDLAQFSGTPSETKQWLDLASTSLRRATVDPSEWVRWHMAQSAVAYEAGDYDAARDACTEALAISDREIGPFSRRSAEVLACLGRAQAALGDTADAVESYRRGLGIEHEVLGPDHPDVASFELNLAQNLSELGEIEAARTGFERALEIWRANLGHDSPYLGFAYLGLADLAALHGGANESLTHYDLAIDAFSKHRPDFDLHLVLALTNSALALTELERFDRARENAERALAVAEESFGSDHLLAAEPLIALGELDARTDREAGLAKLRDALRIKTRALPADHHELAELQRSIEALETEPAASDPPRPHSP